MTKRLTTLVPAALAAGAALLLTACDPADTAADSTSTTSSTTAPATTSTSTATSDTTSTGGTTAGETTGGGSDLQPVDCGELDVYEGVTHTLVADPADDGLVGCTEAFNVVTEYLRIPAAERSASFEGIAVSGGWTCSTDDGESGGVGCVKGKVGDGFGLSLHTEPV